MLDHDRDHQREKKCVPLDIHPKGTKIFIEGNLYPFEFRTEIHRRGSLFLKSKACFRFGEWTEWPKLAFVLGNEQNLKVERILLMRIWKLGNLSPAKEFFFKSRSKSCFLSLFESWLHAKRHKRLTVFWNLSFRSWISKKKKNKARQRKWEPKREKQAFERAKEFFTKLFFEWFGFLLVRGKKNYRRFANIMWQFPHWRVFT